METAAEIAVTEMMEMGEESATATRTVPATEIVTQRVMVMPGATVTVKGAVIVKRMEAASLTVTQDVIATVDATLIVILVETVTEMCSETVMLTETAMAVGKATVKVLGIGVTVTEARIVIGNVTVAVIAGALTTVTTKGETMGASAKGGGHGMQTAEAEETVIRATRRMIGGTGGPAKATVETQVGATAMIVEQAETQAGRGGKMMTTSSRTVARQSSRRVAMLPSLTSSLSRTSRPVVTGAPLPAQLPLQLLLQRPCPRQLLQHLSRGGTSSIWTRAVLVSPYQPPPLWACRWLQEVRRGPQWLPAQLQRCLALASAWTAAGMVLPLWELPRQHRPFLPTQGQSVGSNLCRPVQTSVHLTNSVIHPKGCHRVRACRELNLQARRHRCSRVCCRRCSPV
mmetsp:Transcript_73931/g.171501  ORF Transcript_73931/g.171501 Transcript_73931/m.171501 type:complete len:400 (+) Transcript_73931:454-1653(+)